MEEKPELLDSKSEMPHTHIPLDSSLNPPEPRKSDMNVSHNPLNPENQPILPKQTIPSIMKFFLTQFIKAYGFRIIYSLLKTLFSLKKSGIKGFTFDLFLSAIFNMPNLRTALFISLMPTLYKMLKLLFKTYLKNESPTSSFISGFISSLIAVLVEEKTDLMNFVILSVMVRVMYVIAVILIDYYNLPKFPRTANLVLFVLASIGFIFLAFCHPSFTPINKLFLNYANLEPNEVKELQVYTDRVKIM